LGTIDSSQDMERQVVDRLNGGDMRLVSMMRLAMSNSILANAVFSEWEQGFLTDVAAKSRTFGDKLTEKQGAKAKQILSRPEVVTMLASLLKGELEISPISESAPSPIHETAKTDYAADPEWGLF
jgi:hypothetical protein